jgi:hypothetical protein
MGTFQTDRTRLYQGPVTRMQPHVTCVQPRPRDPNIHLTNMRSLSCDRTRPLQGPVTFQRGPETKKQWPDMSCRWWPHSPGARSSLSLVSVCHDVLTGLVFLSWPNLTLPESGHFKRGSRRDMSLLTGLYQRPVVASCHKVFIARTTITFSFEVRFRWSWIFWKAYAEGYTFHMHPKHNGSTKNSNPRAII